MKNDLYKWGIIYHKTEVNPRCHLKQQNPSIE